MTNKIKRNKEKRGTLTG